MLKSTVQSTFFEILLNNEDMRFQILIKLLWAVCWKSSIRLATCHDCQTSPYYWRVFKGSLLVDSV